MAWLVDFLKCLPSNGQKDGALASLEFKEWQELRKECDMMLERGYFHGGRDLSDPERLVLKKEQRLFDAVWKQYQFIPSQMYESVLGAMTDGGVEYHQIPLARCLGGFINSPRVELSEIREAAAKLSYMIIPLTYMDIRIGHAFYKMQYEISSISCQISDIKEYTEQDLYALCPVSLYNLCQVEEETTQPEEIFGGELMQTRALLDTVTRIQRNLFALLAGNEADTDVWEIGEGCGCSENELRLLKILVGTIMPIQRSLWRIARDAEDMETWEKEMKEKHSKEVSKILQEAAQRLSWSEEARNVIKKTRKQANPREIFEAAEAPDVLVFSLRHGTSLIYGNEPATVLRDFGMNMPESFYLNRGFTRQNNEGLNIRKIVSYYTEN